MSIISKKVYTASKPYTCGVCHKDIAKGEKYLRLFGSSDDVNKSPPPRTLCICKMCGAHDIVGGV